MKDGEKAVKYQGKAEKRAVEDQGKAVSQTSFSASPKNFDVIELDEMLSADAIASVR